MKKMLAAFAGTVMRFVGNIRHRCTQPGGHPTIPLGKIIAHPTISGGYTIFEYGGTMIGWTVAGKISAHEDVQKAMRNLGRPTVEYISNEESSQAAKPPKGKA